jgi:hypothetical protein
MRQLHGGDHCSAGECAVLHTRVGDKDNAMEILQSVNHAERATRSACTDNSAQVVIVGKRDNVGMNERFRYTIMAGEYSLGHAASRGRALALAAKRRSEGERPNRLVLRRRQYPFTHLRERAL